VTVVPGCFTPSGAPISAAERADRERRDAEAERAKEQQRAATAAAEKAKNDKFKEWALKNTAVTDIEIKGVSMFVTLSSDKYTNRDNCV
jgi:hypothetical protein